MATKKAMPFSGKDTKAEEMAEARAVRSGKMPVKTYARKEAVEDKREGERPNMKKAVATGKAIASGKMSPAKYAAQDVKKKGR